MREETHESLRRLFEQVLELPAAERATCLDRECPPSLRPRLEALLAGAEGDDAFLAEPPVGAAPTVATSVHERAGTMIGRYKLLQQIGEGGFGVVFLAGGAAEAEHAREHAGDARRGGAAAAGGAEEARDGAAGDLDWIVMRCLEKDRARRYDTAVALADDVRRHLAHEPVLASPPGAAYRLRKFVRRHKAGVVTTARKLGQPAETVACLREALELRGYPADHPERARTLLRIAQGLSALRELDRAVEPARQALGDLPCERGSVAEQAP
jgi:hypothetical protein